jgi:hypothetical protein
MREDHTMPPTLTTFLHVPVVHGALSGLGAAALVDVRVFLSYKKIDDIHTFDWRVAVLRWLQGLVSGALVGAGLGAL